MNVALLLQQNTGLGFELWPLRDRYLRFASGDRLGAMAQGAPLSADLVVISREQKVSDRFHAVDPAEAVVRMGRPTLLVPEHGANLKADRVLVGWKDTREARVAVRDALPFLSRASQVTVVEICTSDEQDAARVRVRDVARYLIAHGAKCRTDVRVHMSEPDAYQLVRLARDEGADLIVTGAYGHSRLGEWMLGGMTRSLLKDAPLSLMMSHEPLWRRRGDPTFSAGRIPASVRD